MATSATLNKDKPVATTKAPVDISTLSYAELSKLISSAQAAVEGKRKTEIAEIAKTFTDALAAAGYSKADGLEALGVRAAASTGTAVVSRPKAGKGVARPKNTGPKPKWGQSYKNPITGDVWTKSASGKGKTVSWLADEIAAGKTFEEFEA